jgi:MYXO-CTERM domain-containing protein
LRLPALCAALAALLLAPPAAAFCRTTTTPVPANYDPTKDGCPQGQPLAWHASRAPYGVVSAASKQVSLADAVRVADLAFAAWNDASCPGGAPSVQAYDDGPISMVPEGADCMTSTQCQPQTHDVIVFDDAMWPYHDNFNTLALTTVTYGMEDGTIFEAYTEVNTAQHEITAQEPPPASAYDLQAILTHEAGHFFGLAHATETTSIMYAFYHPGATHLTSDDTAGFCSIYPPGSSPKSGCACESGPPQARGAALFGAAVLASMGAWRRRQRRVSRRARGY